MAVRPGAAGERGRRQPVARVDGSESVAGVPGPVRLLLRLSGEVATKSRRTRRRFHRTLVHNLRDACRSSAGDATVTGEWSRIFVELTDPGALDAIGRVFGIHTWSLLEAECEASLEAIVRAGTERFGERVRGRRFAVRARRTGEHPFRSRDVMRELGAALGREATVDLETPDVEACVEVRGERAFLFSDRVPGAGGLPLGVEGKAVALLSGGFDSAVAAWMAMRRGVALEYVFCNLGGGAYRRLVLEVAKSLADRWSYGDRPRIHVLDFGPVARELAARVHPAYQQLILKRQMYRAATRVAEERGAQAIVTGEAVGQVSTQTLTNLRAIDDAAGVPVLRPLLGFDKAEIIDLSRRIGTHDLSARVREYCAISPGRPATAARRPAVAREDAALDPAVLADAVAGRETLSLRALDDSDIVAPALFVDEVREGAVVIDTREEVEYAGWHWPGAIRRDFEELLEEFGGLDRDAEYVLYCAVGLKSGRLAERMQAAGYEAYSFRGGARALRRLETRGRVGAGEPGQEGR